MAKIDFNIRLHRTRGTWWQKNGKAPEEP